MFHFRDWVESHDRTCGGVLSRKSYMNTHSGMHIISRKDDWRNDWINNNNNNNNEQKHIIFMSVWFIFLINWLRVLLPFSPAGQWWDGGGAHREESGYAPLQEWLSAGWLPSHCQTGRDGGFLCVLVRFEQPITDIPTVDWNICSRMWPSSLVLFSPSISLYDSRALCHSLL